MQDHLMEAVEGTLRLKRLLSEDEEVPEEVLGKRRRKKESSCPSPDEGRINELLGRWGLLQDRVARHVLESLTKEELQLLDDGYKPDRFNAPRGL